MLTTFVRCTVIAGLLLPAAAVAEPVKLKLAYFTSDRNFTYRAGIKPFVDAVNSEGRGVVEIEPHVGGSLGKIVPQQVNLVLNGKADIAFVVIGMTPKRFPDTTVVEMPGLFRNSREATLVYTALATANLLKGYEDFFVIGAYGTDPETIHTRQRVASLADLKGLRIRANNPIEVAAIEKLGMKGVLMPVNKTAVAIGTGEIEGALVPPIALFQFGIGRIANHHYLLGTSVAPLALLMSRKRFEGLPKQAQDVIRKYGGKWLATRYGEFNDVHTKRLIDQLRADSKRNVVVPSTADLKTAATAFKAVTEEWAARNPAHKALLGRAEAELRKVRSAE